MTNYYDDRLAGDALLRCYELASPRIRQYLTAEIDFVIDRVRGARRVLELGCGYGRVLKRVNPFVRLLVGCDTSRKSLVLTKSFMKPCRNYSVVRTDAAGLASGEGAFDVVFCIQNGISAFGVDCQRLIAEATRVAREGGYILFSTYSPRIWQERLGWFRAQSEEGLLGEIDEARTREGTIVCRDGFRATTVGWSEFVQLFSRAGLKPHIQEVDDSSLFCMARA